MSAIIPFFTIFEEKWGLTVAELERDAHLVAGAAGALAEQARLVA